MKLKEAKQMERNALRRVERAAVALEMARRAVKEATAALENAAVHHALECARWERAKEKVDSLSEVTS